MDDYKLMIVVGGYEAKTSQVVSFSTRQQADEIAAKVNTGQYMSQAFVIKLY